MTLQSRFLVLFFVALGGITSCVHKPSQPAPDGDFPAAVGNILIKKCATAGCHNAASYVNANNLRLDNWERMFDGSSNGSVVVPYSPSFSSLLYYVNTDTAWGTVATPTMPLSTTTNPQAHLTKQEYDMLRDWIAAGAPDKNGNVAFASNDATRQKIYLTQQGCDLVAVIDAERHVVMRYINIGMSPGVEAPHSLRVTASGAYAYVSFLGGNYVQKIDTRTDQIAGSANVGMGAWNILYLPPSDTLAIVSDWSANGSLAFIRTGNMVLKNKLSGSDLFVYPHGITSTSGGDTLFVTGQNGNVVYKLNTTGTLYKKLSLDGNPPVTTASATTPDPHEIMMSPDYTRYFVTCEKTNEVKVMDPRTDTIIATIPVGIRPQEIAMSYTRPYLFVTCMEDVSTLPGRKGTVYVINYNTLAIEHIINGDFYQPHGLAVDDRNGTLYVASANISDDGPAPHHATACFGRAGWYSIFNINTMQPVNNRRYQVSVMPYSAAARFRQ